MSECCAVGSAAAKVSLWKCPSWHCASQCRAGEDEAQQTEAWRFLTCVSALLPEWLQIHVTCQNAGTSYNSPRFHGGHINTRSICNRSRRMTTPDGPLSPHELAIIGGCPSSGQIGHMARSAAGFCGVQLTTSCAHAHKQLGNWKVPLNPALTEIKTEGTGEN